MTDFFQAEFAGTGTLTAYTPEIGSALTNNAKSNGYISPPIDDTGYTPGTRLGDQNRASAGKWVSKYNSGWPGFNLYTSSMQASPDYYLETVLDLSGVGTSEALYHAHVLRGIRGTGGEAQYFDALFSSWAVEYYAGSWRVQVFFDQMEDRFAYDGLGSYSAQVGAGEANVAAGEVTLRTEIEGGVLRAFIDGVKVLETTWSGTTYFNGAGHILWSYYFNGVANGAFSTMAVSAMRAGDAFVPPPPGDFWQDFVKTVEA